MSESPDKQASPQRFLPREEFQSLVDGLRRAGYRCMGPRIKEGAISYGPLHSVDELPRGVHDEQSPGVYRLRRGSAQRCFAWANGPQALKPLLFAPRESLWRVDRDDDGRIHFL